METYKNDYSKNEDHTLWELHEIRHKLHQKRRNKSLEKINQEALIKYATWKKNVSNHRTKLTY
ncbi:hypothetical protein MHK_004203 [Candidatus Magnetomorum sp. HK-1]|nr:hypothetical protein MHK_004203 [Candidatus Magnetomorum sp. HK-1]